jgi:glyoxylase-like metal-dependent hydrolase (beta-lactamase superfamily II)
MLNLEQRKLSDSVIVFDGHYPEGGNVTSTVVHSGNHAFVFDSLLYPEDTLDLLRSLKDLNLNPEGLVNTHWHLDHTAGNQLFLETKRIISHSLCNDLMHTDLPSQINWLNEELKEEGRVRATYPNEAISDGSVLKVGDQEIKFLHTPGHTPDSIIAWLEDENVIVAGDTVMELPYLWHGESQALIESLKRVQSIVRGGKIVQGHGGICGREKLGGDVSYIENVRKLVAEYLESGKTAKEAAAGIKLADCVSMERIQSIPKLYEEVHRENVERIYAELGNKLIKEIG